MKGKGLALACMLGFKLQIHFVNAQAKVFKSDVNQLVQIMSGAFSSEAQSKTDSAFFNISLKMKPIWTNKKGENWLYIANVEQRVT